MVLVCSIALGSLSLLGLGRGTQEEQHYHALNQSSLSGTTDDLRPSGDQEEQHYHALDQSSTSGTTDDLRPYMDQEDQSAT